MRAVMLGAPGSGKGTQAARLSRRLGVPVISTGEILRSAVAEGAPLGQKAKAVMDSGELVPDDVMIELVRERLAASDARGGFILDGFPRTLEQARALEALLEGNGWSLSGVINLSVPEPVLLERLDGRSSEGRSDDRRETISERLRVYRDKSEPLADFYRRRRLLADVDGVGDVGEIERRIERVLTERARGVA